MTAEPKVPRDWRWLWGVLWREGSGDVILQTEIADTLQLENGHVASWLFSNVDRSVRNHTKVRDGRTDLKKVKR